MIRLLIWLLLIYIGYRVIISLVSGKKKETVNHDADAKATITHRDPVCGLYVSESDAVVGRLDGERHYFCSIACLEKYREQLDHTR
jgi:YHS domain-containing protein